MKLNRPSISEIKKHIRHPYMSGVHRSEERIQNNSEMFTPTELVNEVLDRLDPMVFSHSNKTFLDPSCGDGQFLGEVLIRKIENGIDFESALLTIYGVELMQDNVDLCRKRLLCGQQDLQHIVEKNIVCADALKYNYTFGEKDTFGHGLFEIQS
jgi:type I restriction-modification system DNA methylase subunit